MQKFSGQIILGIMMLALTPGGFAQIFEPEGLNMPGAWNSWTNPPTNNLALASATQVTDGRVTKITTGTTRWQTIFSVAASGGDIVGDTYTWVFSSGPSGSPYANTWKGVSVSLNTVQAYSHNAGGDNSITLDNGNWYTMNWKDNGYTNTDAIFMETSGEPVLINAVAQAPENGSVNENDPVTITVTTSASPSVEEKLFVWYSLDNFATSAVVELSFTGTSGTADIPGQNANTTVKYRIVSSTIALSDAQTPEYYWMRSIRYSTEYSYAVDPAPTPGEITLSAPADDAANEWPRVTFTWQADANATSYDLQVSTIEEDFSSPVIDQTLLSATSSTVSLLFETTYYWRVRGVNAGGNGNWSSTFSFTTIAPSVNQSANSGSGFGGVVGNGTLKIADDGTDVYFQFTKGAGDFNNMLVIYFGGNSEGRSLIDNDVNDQNDDHRRAISSAGDNASVLYFPIGFEAEYALAINTSFGGLWSIPATGTVENGGLDFVTALNDDFSSSSQSAITFYFSLENIGAGTSEAFKFLGVYLNSSNGFTSNEGFGFSQPDNVGGNPLNFTSYFNYPTGAETSPVYSLQSGDWSNNSTWSSGTPPSNNDVNIHTGHTINLSGTYEITNLGINKGANLEINTDGSLTVSEQLSVDGSMRLHSDGNGTASLIASQDFNDAIVLERFVEGSSNPTAKRYHLVSVPLKQSANPTAALFMHSYLYYFDATGQTWEGVGDNPGFSLNVDEGYMIWYTGNTTTYEFTGSVNTGDFVAAMGSGASTWDNDLSAYTGGYNLVPNPYPSAIDWDVADGFVSTNLFNTIWIYDRNSGNYGTYVRGNGGIGTNNVSNIIPVGQAFFVQANTAGTPSLTLNNLARTHSNNSLVKQSALVAELLRIKAATEEYSDEALIAFDEAASEYFDPEFDAQKLRGAEEAPQIYTTSEDGLQLSINKIPYQTETIVIAFGIEHLVEDEIHLSFDGIASFGEWSTIYFEDLLTGEMIDLSTQNTYNFTHEPEHDPLRFRLHFMGVTANSEIAETQDDFKIWNAGQILYIESTTLDDSDLQLELFDMQGRMIGKHQLRGSGQIRLEQGLSQQMILVRITSSQSIANYKIFIR